jgi:hypothetical protein
LSEVLLRCGCSVCWLVFKLVLYLARLTTSYLKYIYAMPMKK